MINKKLLKKLVNVGKDFPEGLNLNDLKQFGEIYPDSHSESETDDDDNNFLDSESQIETDTELDDDESLISDSEEPPTTSTPKKKQRTASPNINPAHQILQEETDFVIEK